jgi:hypothetical protein
MESVAKNNPISTSMQLLKYMQKRRGKEENANAVLSLIFFSLPEKENRYREKDNIRTEIQ